MATTVSIASRCAQYLRVLVGALLVSAFSASLAEPYSDQVTPKPDLKAAEQGVPCAQLAVCLAYFGGNWGFPEDIDRAFTWCRKAADREVRYAQLYLGIMYGAQESGRRDDAQALAWYRKAAEQGAAAAQLALCKMYQWGRGTARDSAQAYFWCSLAARARKDDPAQVLFPGHAEDVAKFRDLAASNMTSQQVKDAKAKVRRWKPKQVVRAPCSSPPR